MSATLDPLQMTAMRDLVVTTMIDSAAIMRKETFRDAGGGFSDKFDPVAGATDVPCRIAPSARLPREVATEESVISEGVWIITLPFSTGPSDPTNFSAADRIQVTMRETGIVMMFEVMFAIPDRTNVITRRATLRLVV